MSGQDLIIKRLESAHRVFVRRPLRLSFKNLVLWASLAIGLGLLINPGMQAYGSSSGEESVMSEGAEKLIRIIKALNDNTSSGVSVVRVRDGKKLFSYDGGKLLSPASVTKLVTAGAALKLWGADHTFSTKFYYVGRRSGETIYGDLYIKGDGDPYLVSEKLWQMAADLKNMGIRKITGDIVLDQSLFDGVQRDKSRLAGQKSSRNAYDAPVSAFGVNFNTFEVMVVPSEKLGSKALVSLSPYPVRSVTLQNQVKTVAKTANQRPSVKRQSTDGGGSLLVSSGGIPLESSPQKIYRSVTDPGLSSGEIVRAFLAKEDVVVAGKTRQADLPPSAILLYTLPSYPVSKIVKGLNVFSNNYIADVLVKRMGAAFNKKSRADEPGSGTYEAGVSVLSDFLGQKIGQKNFVLKNGSGLSTENRLPADLLSALLVSMSSELESFPEFLSSLPTSGVDGTLRSRFSSPLTKHLQGRIRAKTGTLTSPVSVSSLSGYVSHQEHGLLAFSIIQNGLAGKTQPAISELRLSQEKMLVAMLSSL